MFKITGIIFILVGCVGYGLERIGREHSRVEHLREMIRIIRRIQDEISYGKHTLPEVCLILSEHCSDSYRLSFRQIYEQANQGNGTPFGRVWEQQMRLCLRDAPLTEEEKDILRNLPQSLGMQDEKLQAENIGRSMDLLGRKCRKAEDAYENKARMILSVSLITGVFLIILLV